jgi:L-fuculose-phosphate aldolase
MKESQLRADLAEVCRLAYARGYICAKEGNFSARLNEGVLLCTPRGVCKGRVKPEDMVLSDYQGRELVPDNQGYKLADIPPSKMRVSTELSMHLAAYSLRADVGAAVHAHPTVAVGFSVAGKDMAQCVLPEVVSTMGIIPTAPYATPGTDEVVDSIKDLIVQHDVLIMDHHGALAVGSDIWDAFYKLETLEHQAQTMLVAHLLGGVKPLSGEQVKKLINKGSMGQLQKEQCLKILTEEGAV